MFLVTTIVKNMFRVTRNSIIVDLDLVIENTKTFAHKYFIKNNILKKWKITFSQSILLLLAADTHF